MSNIFEEVCEKYGYVYKNNILLFQKGPLSQWWGGFKDQESEFSDYERTYNCCEQYMMFKKARLMGDFETSDKILQETHPGTQKKLGREIKNFDEQKWKSNKEWIVYSGNMMKFNKNKFCKDFMLSIPRFSIICEAAPWDPVWGNGLDINDPDSLDVRTWKGTNLLGKCLMSVKNNISS